VFLKKKKFRKNQIILKMIFIKNELKRLIHKSLFRNHFNNFLFRLSFTISDFFNKQKNFFKSLQKLFCPFTLEKKVPSKHFLFSRFFLNKRLNGLLICNTFK
jgi:hypothetical protein